MDEILKFGEYKTESVQANYNYFCKTLTEKVLNMFNWKNLPSTCSERFLNLSVLLNGNCAMIKSPINGELNLVRGGLSDEIDIYDIGTAYTYSNVKYSGTEKLTDIAICFNDQLHFNIRPLIARYANMLANADSSITIGMVNTRLTSLVSASTEQSQRQAQEVVNGLLNGEFSVLYDSALLGNITASMLGDSSKNSTILETLVKVRENIYSQFCIEIGIPMVNHMKRAQLISDESDGVSELSQINISDMLEERKKFCDRCNELYGLDITVELNELWRTQENVSRETLESEGDKNAEIE